MIFSGLKSVAALQNLLINFALLMIVFTAVGMWCLCALLVGRGHDQGASGMPVLVALVFTFFFLGTGVLEIITEESCSQLIFPKDRNERSVFTAIFMALGFCMNLYFWNGLRKGSAIGAEEYGPLPPPDEEVTF